MLGEREIRRWVRLVAIVGAGQEKSSELVYSALVRARFCELLSPRIGAGDSDLFLLGLSLMDAIMDIPMTQILESIPIDQESKAVLLGGASRLGPLYQFDACSGIRRMGAGGRTFPATSSARNRGR